MSVAMELARYASDLKYEDLPKEAVKQAKRALLDTLASPMCGHGSDAAKIEESVARELGGTPESTIIGSGFKTSCVNAARVNGVMTRVPDYQDQVLVFFAPDKFNTCGHASELFPGILALGERQHSSGKDVILAAVLGYEMVGRWQSGDPFEAAGGDTSFFARGFDRVVGAIASPFAAGKILGLNQEQIANALGISASNCLHLLILDNVGKGEPMTMARNLRWPWHVGGGMMAALLAQKGFTGPIRVLEGPDGLVEAALGGRYLFDKLTHGGERLYIMALHQKCFVSEGCIQGTVAATIKVVKEHDIKPEDIKAVRIKAFERIPRRFGGESDAARRPQDLETAGHSVYYVNAIAIIDRALGMDQYARQKIGNPKVHELIDKMTVEGDPDFDRYEAVTEIETKQGARHSSHVLHQKGHYLNPMTDDELEEKFRGPASKHMGERQIQDVIDTVWDLANVDDIGRLMRLLVF